MSRVIHQKSNQVSDLLAQASACLQTDQEDDFNRRVARDQMIAEAKRKLQADELEEEQRKREEQLRAREKETELIN